jgi:hypothetical protein
MAERAQLWARLEDAGTPGEFWALCDQRDKGAIIFVQATSGNGWSKYAELEKVSKLTPWELNAFFNDTDRWEAATWEQRAQYFEFMAEATRMFAPAEGVKG